MKFIFPFLLVGSLLISCGKKTTVDLILLDAKIYTVDSTFRQEEAIAIKGGEIIAIGDNAYISNHYTAPLISSMSGKTILPGWIDAHCHFYGLGLMRQRVDLTSAGSFNEVLNRLIKFQKENNHSYLLGEGWDQNLWNDKTFPNKTSLDSLFPTTPVAIRRIDGHALLVNQAALSLANITTETVFKGGSIEQKGGELTGIIIDKPMQLIFNSQPPPSRSIQIKALKEAENICFSHGLTSVTDAGLDHDIIQLIDSLQKAGELKIRINAMINFNQDNLAHYIKKPPYTSNLLQVNSFKVYADGSLGSRGACLKEHYSDKKGHHGHLLSSIEELEAMIQTISNSPYQLNSHAIGDSTNKVMLSLYQKHLKNKPNRRWRIEHAQVLDPSDYPLFSNGIIPSVQPTHAISDMLWAKDRLGEDRISTAYAYSDLLAINGIIALGTDFPIEKVDPRLTFHAAVSRQNTQQEPEMGFQTQHALSREQTLRGMTIWAAFASFEEQKKGSLEVGKLADFIVLDQDIMKIEKSKIPTIQIEQTYLDGELVFKN